MRANEVSKLTGVSVRGLHHYDQIGLLRPERSRENGYREYSQADLDRLQQILFFRACGLELAEIANILDRPDYDSLEALKLQRHSLLHQREQLDTLLQTVEQTIKSMEGGTTMSNQEKFKGFDFSENPYEAEARERWGNQAVDNSNAFVNNLSHEGKAALGKQMNQHFFTLAALRHLPADDSQVQAAVAEYCRFLGQFYDYSPQAIKGLGQMYVDDPRFTKNIDQFGDGTAAFLAQAMAVYADNL